MLSSIRRCAVRPPLDLSLYLVTDTAMCARLGVPTTVAAAVAAGVTLVQLRDPAASDVELVALGRDVAAALAGTGAAAREGSGPAARDLEPRRQHQ